MRPMHAIVSLLALSVRAALGRNEYSGVGEAPVSISGPVPAIADSYAVGSSDTVVYTLQNNVPESFPLTVSGLSGPLSRVSVSDDCGDVLPASSTCKLGVDIAPTEAGTVNQVLTINYEGRGPFEEPIDFSVTSAGLDEAMFLGASCASSICVAAGQNSAASPLTAAVAQSTNNGESWTIPSISPQNASMLYAVSCASSDSEGPGICVAAGGFNVPELIQSTNNGGSWAIPSVPGLPENSALFAASCTPRVCVAVGGGAFIQSSVAYVIVTADNGEIWSMPAIAGLPASGSFSAVSCASSDSEDPDAPVTCVAAGYSDSPTTQPTLGQSTDSGINWALSSITGGLPADGGFSAASCAYSGVSMICIAGGSGVGSAPVLTQTINNGASWTYPTIADLPVNGHFYEASCVFNGSGVTCIAVGGYDGEPALMVRSTDSAATWAVVDIPGLPSVSLFQAASCVYSGSGVICVAAGYSGSSSTPSPILAQSTDGAITWAMVTAIPNMPANGKLSAVSCSGDPLICIAAGYGNNSADPVPLLIKSVGGGAWQVVDLGLSGGSTKPNLTLQGPFYESRPGQSAALSARRVAENETLYAK